MGATLQVKRTSLDRKTPFAFSCNRCLRCCRDKKIQVNPYEIARLADNRGISTTRFLSRFTSAGGTVLRRRRNNTCVFLSSDGCSVHRDRPLVCRLYPLGRHIRFSGEESFSEVEPDPECEAACTEDGRIEDYLEAQGAAPFMVAADAYLSLFRVLCQSLQENIGEADPEGSVATVFRDFSGDRRKSGKNLLDIDRVVGDYCENAGMPFPEGDTERKMIIHVQAIEAWEKDLWRREK